MIIVRANARNATYISDDLITSGSVGIPVTFNLSEDFDGLSAIAVFEGSSTARDVALMGDSCVVPHEVLATAGGYLRIGIYASNADGTIVIPTVWAGSKLILQGTEPSEVDPSEPTPSWAAQVQEAAAEALANSEEAIEIAGGADAAAEEARRSASAAATSATDAGQFASAAGTAQTAAEAAQTAAASASDAAVAAQGGAENSAQAAAGSATAAAGSAAAAAASEAAAREVQESIPQDYTALSEDVSELKSHSPSVKDSTTIGPDLDISDPSGNVLARFEDGHIKTKAFDSTKVGNLDELTTTDKGSLVDAINEVNAKPSGNNSLSVEIQSDDESADFYLSDVNGNGLLRFSGGNIQTQKFNSDQSEYKLAIDYTDIAGRGIISHFFPAGTDLALHTVTGEVGSQYLSHNLLVYGYINTSGTAVQLGREYGFNYFPVHLPADAIAVYVDYPANLLWHQSTTLYFSAFSEASFQRKPVIVTVSPDGTKDYTTLRTAVDAVAPYASDFTPYEIHLYPGTYDVLSEYSANEIAEEGFVGIMITNGIKLLGMGKREEVVITAEMDTTEYDSTKRNAVSTLNIKGNVWLENLTIYATAIRYCIHDDYASPTDKPNKKTLRNLKLQGFNLTTQVFTYGAGGQGKTIDAKDCDFTNAFHVHNGNNPSKPYSVFLENCTAKRFTFADRDATAFPTRIYMNNCKAPFIEIRGSDTEHDQSLFIDGINVGDPMIICPSGYVYSVGKCDKFDDAVITAGYAVKLGATGNKVPAVTTSLDDIYGISIGMEDGCTVVQYGGYVSSNTLGISGLSIGDYLTIDTTTGAVVSGGTSANAIAKVRYIDPDGVAYAKITI